MEGSWEKWIRWMPLIELRRAACRNMQQRAVLNTDGFSQHAVWSSPYLYRAPTAPEPRQMHQRKQVWAGLVQHSSRGSSVHRGAGEWEGAPPGALPAGGLANLGLPMIRALTCVYVCVHTRILPDINTDPGSCPHSPTLPGTGLARVCACTGRVVGKAPATGAARTPFQGENCPFWGLWSLSGILGKFFLVKDSPPLPCSGRCLYGAFQVPEELWEDFLFPFCYMAESQMSLGQIQ